MPSATISAKFDGTFTNQPTLTAASTAQGIWLATGDAQDVTINAASAQTLNITGTATLNGQTNAGIIMSDTANHNLTIGPNVNITLCNATGFYNNEASGLLTVSGGLNTNAKALAIAGTGATTLSGVVSGSGAITISNGGTATISNITDTYSGQLTVQNGKLKIDTANNTSANGELGNNALAVILGNTGGQTGTLDYTGVTAASSKKFTMATGGTGAFQIDTAAAVLTLSGVIDGGGALTKTGGDTASVLLLSGGNSYSGGLNVVTGTVKLGNTTGSGAATNIVSVGTGATFDIATFSPTIGGLTAALVNGDQ